jgi:hypothetical protein
MSSFSVFDAKGGEFEGPKASIKLMSTSGNGPRKGDNITWGHLQGQDKFLSKVLIGIYQLVSYNLALCIAS